VSKNAIAAGGRRCVRSVRYEIAPIDARVVDSSSFIHRDPSIKISLLEETREGLPATLIDIDLFENRQRTSSAFPFLSLRSALVPLEIQLGARNYIKSRADHGRRILAGRLEAATVAARNLLRWMRTSRRLVPCALGDVIVISGESKWSPPSLLESVRSSASSTAYSTFSLPCFERNYLSSSAIGRDARVSLGKAADSRSGKAWRD